jgi:hypothetical protein
LFDGSDSREEEEEEEEEIILGSSGRVLLISDPPRSWQHNLEALDHIESITVSIK